jgi:formamidopyrimidine-DNA glycosylase
MPELPEVETTRSGLESLLHDHPVIKKVRLMRGDIRFKIPKNLPKQLEGQKIVGVRRRAKYLLFDTANGILLNHLGMTGSWRMVEPGDEDKHDHCYIELENGKRLAFRDPRRFGVIDLIQPGGEAKHKLLKNLGVEPLDETAWTSDYLFQRSRKRKVAIKVFIMNQVVVVGIGNIYASEALYRAQVKPQKLASKVTREECERIVKSSREILQHAIKAGGSSIRDYKQASGESGGFQLLHKVYDRENQECPVCLSKIRAKVLGGRSTYWCPICQK